jgi:3-oxoacyl-[acyl-carrier protein] reductase
VPSAIVTGAGSGIGRATAFALANRGHDLVLVGRREDALRDTERAILPLGRRTVVVRADVSKASEVEAMREVATALGPPDVVVNNAGILGQLARVAELPESEWDAVLATNLKGAFLVTRALLPAMLKEKRGRIVNVASISATLGTPRMSAYVASKWGVVGFTKSLAEELRGSGLQTVAVLPGSVDTAMLALSGFAPQMRAADVAGVIAYVALDAPDGVNGSAVEVFGP